LSVTSLPELAEGRFDKLSDHLVLMNSIVQIHSLYRMDATAHT